MQTSKIYLLSCMLMMMRTDFLCHKWNLCTGVHQMDNELQCLLLCELRYMQKRCGYSGNIDTDFAMPSRVIVCFFWK